MPLLVCARIALRLMPVDGFGTAQARLRRDSGAHPSPSTGSRFSTRASVTSQGGAVRLVARQSSLRRKFVGPLWLGGRRRGKQATRLLLCSQGGSPDAGGNGSSGLLCTIALLQCSSSSSDSGRVSVYPVVG